DRAVIAGRERDVAAGTDEHVEAVRDRDGLDLDAGEILLPESAAGIADCCDDAEPSESDRSHAFSPHAPPPRRPDERWPMAGRRVPASARIVATPSAVVNVGSPVRRAESAGCRFRAARKG